MLRLEVEALVLLIVLVAAVVLYRSLIRSKWFSRLVNSTRPLPESNEDVIGRLDDAECIARERAEQARRDALSNREIARTLRRRVGRRPE